jgi:uncharacterized protein involved in type VI secretion and phage assembly
MSVKRFYGKYRGVITDNKDPLMRGRVRARVPAIFGEHETGWALPCAPYGGKDVGIFFIPPVGAKIWVEFEGGNTEIPIWSGCFWGASETPSLTPEVKIIKTDFATITLNDVSGAGEIVIATITGLKLVMNSSGIELSNGAASVKLTPASVSINDGALEVI